MTLGWILACGHGPEEKPLELVDPASLHLIASSTPDTLDGPALEELDADFESVFTLSFGDGSGGAGAFRRDDGSTVYARTWPPPELGSAVEAIDPEGNMLWSLSEMFSSLSFIHGVESGPDDTLVVADTSSGHVLAFDLEGNKLWSIDFVEGDTIHWPNGIDVATGSDGVTRLAVTMLLQVGSGPDYVDVYTLDGAPELERRYDVGDAAWPHGPHLDGERVVVSLSARGQVVALEGGAEAWRVPEAPGVLAFPRDAVFLPDGTMVVADAATELLRVYNPLDGFDDIWGRATPGVFSVELVDCTELPCLGG